MSEAPDPQAFDPKQSDPTESDSMRHRSPTSHAGASESTPAQPYQVGPGRPPRDMRWKKGGPSPNPRGRPRKDQSMLPDARKALEQALNKKVSVSQGDKKVQMTRIEIGLEQLLNQFAKGDRYARRDLMDYADRLGIDFLAKHKQTLEQALAPNYQTILDAYVARRGGASHAAPAERMLAPPELLDDDRAEPDPTLAPPSVAEAKPAPAPEPEPPQKPGVQYPKPFSRMTYSERRAWYPELYAKKALGQP
jgi:hypothetical protein